MIYIFGDSHAESNFNGLKTTNNIFSTHSITMHRIGRDGIIINFDENYNDYQKDSPE